MVGVCVRARVLEGESEWLRVRRCRRRGEEECVTHIVGRQWCADATAHKRKWCVYAPTVRVEAVSHILKPERFRLDAVGLFFPLHRLRLGEPASSLVA